MHSNGNGKFDNIPSELKARPQWVRWRYEERVTKNGVKKTSKLPTQLDGCNASSTNSDTWVCFENVVNSALGQGIGYVLADHDPYIGIDLDSCLYEDGTVTDWAREILNDIPSYAEISPSGTGIKIITRADLFDKDETGCSYNGEKLTAASEEKNPEIAIFARGRYFTITGDVFEGRSSIKECQASAAELLQRIKAYKEEEGARANLFSSPAATTNFVVTGGPVTNAEDVIAKMFNARNGDVIKALWRGETSAHNGDASRADFALISHIAFYAGPNPQLIEAVFKQSGLYREGGKSSSYLPTSIRKVIKETRSFYDPSFHDSSDGSKQPGTDKLFEYPVVSPRFVSAAALVRDYPKETDPVIDGILRAGETANIIASPKMGKSWLSLGLALSVATGQQWLGKEVTQGRVLLIDNELRPQTTASRLRTVASEMGIDLNEVGSRLVVDNMRGRLVDLHKMGKYFGAVSDEGFVLVILDALYRFLPADANENSNGDMAQLYNAIDRYAGILGNAAFVNIHHASKGEQSQKAITDVGAGAGTQSRAVDAHIILRPHELADLAVFEAAVRSFPPVEPMSLKWEWPLWIAKEAIKPEVKQPKSRQESRQDAKDRQGIEAILEACGDTPVSMKALRKTTGFGHERMNRLIAVAKREQLIKEVTKKNDKRKTRYIKKVVD